MPPIHCFFCNVKRLAFFPRLIDRRGVTFRIMRGAIWRGAALGIIAHGFSAESWHYRPFIAVKRVFAFRPQKDPRRHCCNLGQVWGGGTTMRSSCRCARLRATRAACGDGPGLPRGNGIPTRQRPCDSLARPCLFGDIGWRFTRWQSQAPRLANNRVFADPHAAPDFRRGCARRPFSA